jgi:hypothetical protein
VPLSSYYVWGANWMPLSAHLSLKAVDAINDSIVAGLRADPGRGREIGGILLGSIEYLPDLPPVIRIEKFDPVDSEYRRGSSYVLTDGNKRTLGKKLAWWDKHGRRENLRPVGFFRSHTRRGLYLDNDDFLLIQGYFPDPQSVFLLVRPVPGAAGVGGFFFWQDGDMRRESSYQEFPFSSAKLALLNQTPVAQEPWVEPAPAANPAPVASVPPVASPAISHAPVASARPAMSSMQVPAAIAQPGRSLARPLPETRHSLPPSPAARKPMPAWLRFTAPIAVGVALGAIVFKVAMAGIFGHVAAPQPTVAMKPAPARPSAAPVASAGLPPAQSLPVEKPSPLLPNSRPTLAPVAAAPKPEKPALAAARPPAAKTPAPSNRNAPAPTGSASRVESAPAASVVLPGLAEPEPLIHQAAPLPGALTAIATPVRVEHLRRSAPVATVTVEPVSGSKLGRIVGRLPGFRRKSHAFVPARPIREITPSVPADEQLARDVPVDLKITVDPAGLVSGVEHTSNGANKDLVRLAENAARSWQFVPARRDDETVSSELILHFTFKSTQPAR